MIFDSFFSVTAVVTCASLLHAGGGRTGRLLNYAAADFFTGISGRLRAEIIRKIMHNHGMP